MSDPKVTVYRDNDPVAPSTVTRTDLGGGAVWEDFDYDDGESPDPPSEESSTDSSSESSESSTADSGDDDGDPSYLDDNS